jgi:hypothetical protein
MQGCTVRLAVPADTRTGYVPVLRIVNQPYPYQVTLLCNWVLHSFLSSKSRLNNMSQDETGDGNEELFQDPINHYKILFQEPKQGAKRMFLRASLLWLHSCSFVACISAVVVLKLLHALIAAAADMLLHPLLLHCLHVLDSFPAGAAQLQMCCMH